MRLMQRGGWPGRCRCRPLWQRQRFADGSGRRRHLQAVQPPPTLHHTMETKLVMHCTKGDAARQAATATAVEVEEAASCGAMAVADPIRLD